MHDWRQRLGGGVFLAERDAALVAGRDARASGMFGCRGSRIDRRSTPDDVRFFPIGTETVDEESVRLSEPIPDSRWKTSWFYEYDFGDGWAHEIEFEGIVEPEEGTTYPVCLDGARACPLEDSGGPWGYTHLLQVLADPQHEEYDRVLEWSGSIDPEAFDAEQATRALRR